MNTHLHKQSEPVCKFGPGGDFVTAWPKEPTLPPQPAPTPVIKSDSLFPVQPMLFPGDWAIAARTGHKTKRCIRAYHRTAKRKPALSLPTQGSLFETSFKSKKTNAVQSSKVSLLKLALIGFVLGLFSPRLQGRLFS